MEREWLATAAEGRPVAPSKSAHSLARRSAARVSEPHPFVAPTSLDASSHVRYNDALQQSGDLRSARFARFIDSPAAELWR